MKTTTNLVWMVVTVITVTAFASSHAMGTFTVSDKGRICGRISDLKTGQLLALASIELFSAIDSSLVVGTLTNNNGEFNFSMVKPGKYFLVVSLDGFTTKRVQPVNVRDGETKVELGEILLTKTLRKPVKDKSSKHIVYARSALQTVSFKR